MVSQYAAMGALEAGISYCHQHLEEIAKVRDIVGKQLHSIPDICSVSSSSGAFYFFLKVKTDLDDLELTKRLVEEYQVAVIPGSTFGVEDGCYLRVAYGSLQPSTAKTGIERLILGLKNIGC